MNAFFYPSKRGINFAKIRGFKFTDYTRRCASGATKSRRGIHNDKNWKKPKGRKAGGFVKFTARVDFCQCAYYQLINFLKSAR